MSLPVDGEFVLGCLETPLSACEAFPVYGDVADQPLYTDEQLQAAAVEELPGPDAATGYTHDQSNVGMCTNSASTAAAEDTRIAQGLPLVKLSAGDLYHRTGHGRDSGSTLTDALRELMTRGVATVARVPYLDWRQDHGETDRRENMVLEAYWAPTARHYFSGLAEGFRGVCGISWPGSKLDGDGWLVGRGGGGGHALMSSQVIRRKGTNKLGAGTRNSWRSTFGVNGGHLVIPEALLGQHFGGCFIIRVVSDFGGHA